MRNAVFSSSLAHITQISTQCAYIDALQYCASKHIRASRGAGPQKGSMKRRRFLSGGIQQESHSFNPVLASRSDFQITEGLVAVEQARGTNSILGGMVDAAADLGVDIVVPMMFRAQSGGPVEDVVFAEVRDRMLEAARRGDFDAIVLPLHGGMLTPTLSDPEGALFRELRAVVGPMVPITAAFDLHAHVSPETLRHCDFLAGYLTNPHCDQGAAGRRAFNAAARMIAGTFDPVCASVHFPMLTLGNDRTDESPLRELHAQAAAAVASGEVEDVSVFNAQQFLDVPGLGQTILVYGNGRADRAQALAMQLARQLWDARHQLVGTYPSLESCLSRAAAPGTKLPLVLGDQGDRVAAGGPGDSTYILHMLLAKHPEMRAVVPIADAAAVDLCLAAGIGATVTISMGGRVSRNSPPVTASGRVVAAGTDARVVVQGPHDAGRHASIGPFAILKVGEVHVALTARANAFLDPEYFRAMGVDLDGLAVIVSRSGYHFTLNFAATGECVTVDSPGMTSYRVQELPFTRARPFYPLDPIEFSPTVQVRRP